MATTVKEKLTNEPFSKTKNSAYIPRIWQVITTEDYNEIEVLALSELPQIDDLLADTNARVTRTSGVKQLGSNGQFIWDINVTYEVIPSGSGTDPNGNLTEGENTRLVSYAVGFNSYAREVDKAYSGNSLSVDVVNTAGQQFDPPIMDLKYNSVLRWTQKETSDFRPHVSSTYMNTVNSGGMSILGVNIADGKGLLRNISSVLHRESDGTVYYETTYEVEINDEGWNAKPPNRGYKQLIDGKLYDIHKGDLNSELENGTEAQQAEALEKINLPANLNEDGTVNTSGTVLYLDFDVKRKTSWRAGLNLVSSIQ